MSKLSFLIRKLLRLQPISEPADVERGDLWLDSATDTLKIRGTSTTATILDSNSGAANLPYDNATSGLIATTVQTAIDELTDRELPRAQVEAGTAYAIVVNDGAGALSEKGPLTDGQLLIGATGTAASAASLTGTANQVTVTPGAGSITLSLPQNIDTGASPQFAGATLSGLSNGIVKASTGALSGGNSVGLTTEVTGVLPLANGGTAKALTAAAGGVVYSDADSLEVTAAGSAGQVLTSNGTSAPTFQDAPSAVVGAITMFGGSSAPTGWFLCDGTAVSRTTYSALFAIVGTSFGAGDGSTTFNVPNMQGLVPRGTGSQSIGGRSKAGPSLGATQEDQMQKITGTINTADSTGTGLGLFLSPVGALGSASATTRRATGTTTGGSYSQQLTLDSSTSPDARVSSTTNGETRVSSLGVNFIIKY